MMIIFFLGIGASSIATALTGSPLEIALGLLAIGVFAAIYHPVGLAMVVHGRKKIGMPLAINGVFGNLGVAAAALLTGYLIDTGGWRNACVLPGVVSIGLGVAYAAFVWSGRASRAPGDAAAKKAAADASSIERATFVRVLSIIVFTTALGGLIFQSTTFALPKIFDERLPEISHVRHRGRRLCFPGVRGGRPRATRGRIPRRPPLRAHRVRVRRRFAAVFFAIMYQLTGVPALIVATVFMLLVFGQNPINDVLVGRITKSEWRSRVNALRSIVTFSVMASTLPLIAGIHASWGFSALFVVMAVASSAIFAAVLVLTRKGVIVGQPLPA